MRNRGGGDCGSSNYSTDTSSDEDAQLKKLHARMCGVGHQKYNDIVPRPLASPGYWLCCLIPLSLIAGYWSSLKHQSQCPNMPANYKIITITSAALCIQTISFFIYLNLYAKLYKWLIVFIPFICGTCIFKIFLNTTWWMSLSWTLFITIVYQRCYIRVMRELPMSFTYGEASILIQGVLLFAVNCCLLLYDIFCKNAAPAYRDLPTLNIIMMSALLWLLIVCVLLAAFNFLRTSVGFYLLMAVFAVCATLMPVTKPLPIILLFDFICRDTIRLYIILFYIALVGATVGVVNWQLRDSKQASTSVRKLFHLLVVFVYVPGILYECTFLYVASGVALALIIIFDLFRILRMPPIGAILEKAFHSFADEKDAGIIAFTPLCLLIGCSAPMWILPCPCYQNENAINPKLLPLFAGILTIGFGDTAASVVGSKFGQTKWRNSSRTLEGSLAYFISILLAIIALNFCGLLPLTIVQCPIVVLATLITCLIEAHTDQIDNLVLPLVFYIIVSLI